MFKFGGASVADAAACRNMLDILAGYAGQKIVVVVSATGKSTNALEAILAKHRSVDREAASHFAAFVDAHMALAGALITADHDALIDDLNDLFVEAEWALGEDPHPNYDYAYDQFVGIGELVSSRIFECAARNRGLSSKWLDARSAIVTDDSYREATVDWSKTCDRIEASVPALFQDCDFVITQGFIASTIDNETTTLGREGSDYSAAIFSYCLNASSMHIWKDVPGVLTCDPTLFDSAVRIDQMTYKEAIEMTYYGAKVIHPKTIKPIQNKGIPLYVRPFSDPTDSGTKISETAVVSYPPVIVIKADQSLLHIATKDFSFVTEHHLSTLFEAFTRFRVHVHLMRNTAISFTVCVDRMEDRLRALIDALSDQFNVRRDDALELITIRHYNDDVVAAQRSGKRVLFEERLQDTIRLVVRRAAND